MPGEELSAEDAWASLRRYGGWKLIRDSFLRFRYGDGFSHSRALALQICLALIPAVIAVIGLSSVIHQESVSHVLEFTFRQMTPGASKPVLSETILRSQRTAGQGGTVALLLGLITAIVAMTTAMGQVERGANRIYGIERDRPFSRKYGAAFMNALTAGVAISLGFVMVVAGKALGDSLAQVYHWPDAAVTAWGVLRWPLGLALALLSVSVLFKYAPRRRQPGPTWLAVGGAVSLGLWLLFTWLLAEYVGRSSSFGTIYGPLTAVIALLLWANLTSIALFIGLAFAAQLEARRAGVIRPVLEDPGPGADRADSPPAIRHGSVL